jgi:hypothetical protein
MNMTMDASADVSSSGGAGGISSVVDAGCSRKHPLLDGGLRYCGAEDCYCSDPDSCFSVATAARCCNVAVVCGGVECKGTHPLVDASTRYCAPEHCYCSATDACLPAASAPACCKVTPQCY